MMDYWWSFAPYWGLLSLGLQVACAVHALKTGRAQYWLWIILFLPGIGCLVYFLVEMLPDLRRRGGLEQAGSLLSLLDRGRRVRLLEEQLDLADTVKNRHVLARAYADAGRLDEAIDLYRRCLEGIHKDDPQIMLELGRAFFEKGSYAEAQQSLLQLQGLHASYRPEERDLLLARTRQALGDTCGALEIYAPLSRRYPGEEARCRYAILLQETGENGKAQEIFNQILVTARRSPRYYRRAQRTWIGLAKRNLAR
jgi:hypothetical protein